MNWYSRSTTAKSARRAEKPSYHLDELATSVKRTLDDEARHNALRLAYVRIVALSVAALLDAAFHLFPRQTIGVDYVPPANAFLASFWWAVAVAAAFALRAGWDSAAFRAALAILDPLIVLTLFALIFDALRAKPKVMHPVVVTAAAFTLIAVTGALRLSKNAAAWSGVLSVAGFSAVAASVDYSLAEALFVCAIIGCAGLLGMRLAENTRRAAAAEGSRVILRRFLPPPLAARRSTICPFPRSPALV